MAEKKKASKPVFRTDSPYAKVELTPLQQPQHDVLVNRLVDLLAPIGAYHSTQPKSRGKHSKKRKREDEKPQTEAFDACSSRPAVATTVLVGFNQVSRHLEALSNVSGQKLGLQSDSSASEYGHLAAVFLLRPLDDLVYGHLPMLCQTASLAHPELSATRLVLLDQSTEKRIADALGQSRTVSVLAIKNEATPETEALLDYVRKHLKAAEVQWLKDAVEGKWLGTKVDVQ